MGYGFDSDEYDRQHEAELQHDEALLVLRMRLCGIVLGVFLMDGNGLSFDGVEADSIKFHTDGVNYLSFKVSQRTYRIPNVQYWTEG